MSTAFHGQGLTGVELLDGGGGGDAVLGDVEVELAGRPRVDDEALVVGVGLEGHAVDEVEVHDLLGVLADVVLDTPPAFSTVLEPSSAENLGLDSLTMPSSANLSLSQSLQKPQPRMPPSSP